MNLLFRVNSWWKKIASFLTIIYLVILNQSYSIQPEKFFLIVLGLIIGAVLTSFINNYFDIDVDVIAGKQNWFSLLTRRVVLTILCVSILLTGIYLYYISTYRNAVIAYMMALTCVWLYSCNLSRFKEKPGFDLIFDGLGTQFFPCLFCVFMLEIPLNSFALICSLWLFFSFGIRSLIIHQNKDFHEDRNAGIRTFVNNVSKTKYTIYTNLLIVLESFLYLTLLYYTNIYIFIILTLSFILLKFVLNIDFVYFTLPKTKNQRIFLFDIYLIFPLILLLYLYTQNTQFIYLITLHLVCFHASFIYNFLKTLV